MMRVGEYAQCIGEKAESFLLKVRRENEKIRDLKRDQHLYMHTRRGVEVADGFCRARGLGKAKTGVSLLISIGTRTCSGPTHT